MEVETIKELGRADRDYKNERVNVEMFNSDSRENEASAQEECTIGKVVNCSKLNIREEPAKTSGVICIVNAGTEVMVLSDAPGYEWVKVCTESGAEGFCIKKYLSISE